MKVNAVFVTSDMISSTSVRIEALLLLETKGILSVSRNFLISHDAIIVCLLVDPSRDDLNRLYNDPIASLV